MCEDGSIVSQDVGSDDGPEAESNGRVQLGDTESADENTLCEEGRLQNVDSNSGSEAESKSRVQLGDTENAGAKVQKWVPRESQQKVPGIKGSSLFLL